ncbi:MAG TPA: hypothetical protein VHC19_01475 [Pirellulales bacterium]|nr:hypothetical protein [Pirellulales bacterium]
MNWRHFQAFVWLRWRLLANGWRRAGKLNFVLMMILVIGVLIASVPLFIGGLLTGMFAFADAKPAWLLYAWDAVIAAFVLLWGVGLLTELQRTESLSMSKFMHLPVSVNGVFVINYLGSLIRLTTVLFAPVMFGFGLGLVLGRGAALLAVFPLSAAFLLMITALTYQFQGWLASLMSNPRRRRTVVVAATMFFVLIFQLPNLLNFMAPWGPRRLADRSNALVEKMEKLKQEAEAGKIGPQEWVRRQEALMESHERETKQELQRAAQQWDRALRVLNWALPIGWLPLGVEAAAEGNLALAFGAFLGMTLIGAASLWRAYRTTIRIYRGEFNAGGRRAKAARATARPRRAGRLLEMRLPGVSEPVAAVALAAFRSLLRSPEAKMASMMPLLIGVVVGASMFKRRPELPVSGRPLAAAGAIIVVLFGMLQMLGNQFGFDRDGFRAFVLSGVSRRDILLGKNLAFAPLMLGLFGPLLAVMQAVVPLRWDHLLAMAPQFVSMYLLFCLMANLVSIYAPLRIAAGSMKPASVKLTPFLLQMLAFMFLFPLLEAPTFIPLAAEAVFEALGWQTRVPIDLLLVLVECAAVVILYHFALNWQGRLLQSREQKILESVTS